MEDIWPIYTSRHQRVNNRNIMSVLILKQLSLWEWCKSYRRDLTGRKTLVPWKKKFIWHVNLKILKHPKVILKLFMTVTLYDTYWVCYGSGNRNIMYWISFQHTDTVFIFNTHTHCSFSTHTHTHTHTVFVFSRNYAVQYEILYHCFISFCFALRQTL